MCQKNIYYIQKSTFKTIVHLVLRIVKKTPMTFDGPKHFSKGEDSHIDLTAFHLPKRLVLAKTYSCRTMQ